ncbi:MAG: murein biosynthesis integral membrane protein MurJ [Halofilum sp. (in: g-proteobacteria)]|nr:murein biosynthesis integral membrane protein MurJ [Halofilum sp. (in: g-proteobacteria)]
MSEGRPGVWRTGGTIGAMTLVSRVLGFVRDMVLAGVFGADRMTDAFFVAFRIPNFLRRLFGEGGFTQAFVPVFTEYKEKHGFESLRDLADHVVGTLLGVLLALTAIGVAFSPALVLVFAPGFYDEPERYRAAADMLRVTFPYLLFISLVATAGGMLQSFSRFAVPAFTPVLLNICLIGGALWAAPRFEIPIYAMAWAVFVAGIVQLAFQLPFLARIGMLPRPRWGWRHPGVQKVLRLLVPTLFGASVAQINLLVDTLVASLLAAGSVSWLYYADRLLEFPLGVFGVALGTAILPRLSSDHARSDPAAFHRTLEHALRLILVIGVPATAGLVLLAGPILTTLFGHGAFGAGDTRMAALALLGYGVGLPAFLAVKVLQPGFFSRQDTRTPVRIGAAALVANMFLNAAITGGLVLGGYAAPHAGLALATALSGWLHAGLLYHRLTRGGAYRRAAGWGPLALRVTLATVAMAALLLRARRPGRDLGRPRLGRARAHAGRAHRRRRARLPRRARALRPAPAPRAPRLTHGRRPAHVPYNPAFRADRLGGPAWSSSAAATT